MHTKDLIYKVAAKSSLLLAIVWWWCLGVGTYDLQARQVTLHPEPSASVATRWEWAKARGQRDTRDGYWIGYSIDKLMAERAFIGAINHSSWNRERSLYAVLGMPQQAEPLPDRFSGNMHIRGEGFFSDNSDEDDVRLLLKEVGILIRFDQGSVEPVDLKISNLSLEVDLRDKPLYWLGSAAHEPSIAHLSALYASAADSEIRKDLVTAIAVHDAPPRVLAFLKGVLEQEEDEEVQKSAVFWTGQQDHPDGLDLLRKVVASRRSMELREHAVFSISQMSLPEAGETLIMLAREEPEREVRKKAIFWLGQIASRQAVDTIEEVLLDEGDVEVQKQAVFALSQLPRDEAVPRLIEIARHHESLVVRKQAIFWLGDTGDPRAVDLLIEIVQSGGKQ